MTIQTNKSINPIIANFAEMSGDSFIRPKDCAEVIGVSIATFWRLVASGQLRTCKLTERTTTIKIKDLRDFIAKKEGQ
jgi:predicted DNA-binding transcriptional regulator AlpA